VKTKVLLCCLLSAAVLAAAPVSPEDLPGDVFDLGEFDRFEASGVSYVAGRLAVVDDTLNSLFMFDARGGTIQALDSARLPPARAKFEDVAFHPETRTFFVVGSHEGWTDETLRQLSVLLEFRLKNVGAIDEASVRQLPLWEGFASLGLWKPRSMKIEGLAIDAPGKTLYVGLREPSDRARVYSVPLDALRRGEPELSLALEFDAGSAESTRYCISGLTWEPVHGGLLVATSTEEEASHRFLGNRLWFARVGSERAEEPVLLWDRFDPGMKAEGLALGSGKLFIVYDNDQDDTEIPSRLRVVPLDAIRARIEPSSSFATN
jgi:hypothetical protein